MKKSRMRIMRAMRTVSVSVVCCSARRGPRCFATARVSLASALKCAAAAAAAAEAAAEASACSAAARSANGPIRLDSDGMCAPLGAASTRSGATRSSGPAGSCVRALPEPGRVRCTFARQRTRRAGAGAGHSTPHPASSATGSVSCAHAAASSSAASSAAVAPRHPALARRGQRRDSIEAVVHKQLQARAQRRARLLKSCGCACRTGGRARRGCGLRKQALPRKERAGQCRCEAGASFPRPVEPRSASGTPTRLYTSCARPHADGCALICWLTTSAVHDASSPSLASGPRALRHWAHLHA
jgi:hypothetical protein